MKSDRDKMKVILRKKMKSIMNIKKNSINKITPFSFCFAQAKFDILMDIDRELKLGVFYKLNERAK